jgi:PAS domain S-box-containing protein
VIRRHRYALAAGATVVAAVLRAALDPWVGNHAQYTVFYLSVALAALAGWRPGVVATVLGGATGYWLFVDRFGHPTITTEQGAVQLALYLVVSAVIVSTVEYGRRQHLASERRGSELRASEIRLRRLYESGIVGVIYWSTNGQITDANDRFLQMVGYTREDLAAGRLDWVGLTPAEFRPLDERSVAELKALGVNREPFEKEYLRKDGTRVPVVVAGAMLDDARLEGVAFVLDITERKRADGALRESERKYRIVADHAHAWEFWTAPDGRFLYSSPSCERVTGYAREAFEADAALFDRIIHPEDQQVYAAHRGAGHEVCATEVADFRIVRRDGAVRWVSHVCTPVYDADGRFLGIRGSNRDITEQREAQQALTAARESAERAKAEAERANDAKDHFLAMLSHELRTPLTPVLAAITMLQDDPRCDQSLRETMEMLRRNVEMEARLIDDLLDVTRIARGRIDLEKKPVLLAEAIREAVEVCRPDIEARRLHFGVDLGPCAPCIVHADIARLQQVFWNLLKNAVKFTPHGGCVGIRCRLENGTVVAEVNDSGIGMEPEDLSRVFSAFEQADRSTARQFGGLGLGLAIARAIVELHDGRIEAFSDGRHKGSTFRVSLPIVANAQLAEADAGASLPVPKAPSGPLHILLVEDHGDTAQMMQLLLTIAGHDVQVAGDVATALEEASRNPFDVLVSDLGLPDGSGADLIRELRRRGYTMPAIALSGYGREEDVQRSRDAGFVEHLVKPASPDRLVETIATVARR